LIILSRNQLIQFSIVKGMQIILHDIFGHAVKRPDHQRVTVHFIWQVIGKLNTERLDAAGVRALLTGLDYIREQLDA